MASHNVMASSASDMVMRTVLSGNEPIRFDATSAKSAVTVHDKATNRAMVSPTNISLLENTKHGSATAGHASIDSATAVHVFF